MRYESIEEYIKSPIKNDHIESVNREIFIIEDILSVFIIRNSFVLFLFFCFLSIMSFYIYFSSYEKEYNILIYSFMLFLFSKSVYKSFKDYRFLEKDSIKNLKTHCKVEIKNSEGYFYDYLSDLSSYELKSLKKLMKPISSNHLIFDGTESAFEDPLYQNLKMNVSGLDREPLMFEFYMCENN